MHVHSIKLFVSIHEITTLLVCMCSILLLFLLLILFLFLFNIQTKHKLYVATNGVRLSEVPLYAILSPIYQFTM